ncbi:MAG: hypothetical protein ABI972_14330 [Acidobacteriota bacterium]
MSLGLAAAAPGAQNGPIREASGVARLGEHLLIADDSTVGRYFRVKLPSRPKPLMILNDLDPHSVRLKDASLAIDLEGIDVLADGRVAVLSERLRSLVDHDGIIAEYDSLFSEVGKRGLEGLAVRPLPKEASRIAVLWEGGLPDQRSLPGRLSPTRTPQPLLPLVLVHDVPAHGRVGRLRLTDAISTVELDVPHLPGTGPSIQRFRAPDLVWTRRGAGWGFIVLISSQNASERPTYAYHWLQRFDLQGKRVGQPLDLTLHVPTPHKGANWEGACWMEPGKSLVLVHESDAKVPAAAFIFDLPPDWQCSPEGL